MCALIAQPFVSFSGMPAIKKSIEAIDIEMEGEILIAESDNPNDPLKRLLVYNMSLQLVAETYCSGQQCTLDLSPLPGGYYTAVAITKFNKLSEQILLH